MHIAMQDVETYGKIRPLTQKLEDNACYSRCAARHGLYFIDFQVMISLSTLTPEPNAVTYDIIN